MIPLIKIWQYLTRPVKWLYPIWCQKAILTDYLADPRQLSNLIVSAIVLWVSVLITLILSGIQNHDIIAFELILSVPILVLLELRLNANRITKECRRRHQQRALHRMEIGIILEGTMEDPSNTGKDPHPFTSFTSCDWKCALENEGLKVEFISVSDDWSSLGVIVNPYGEAYPEVDSQKLTTLSKVSSFLSDGGVFANLGGGPFYYAWDFKRLFRLVLAHKVHLVENQHGLIVPAMGIYSLYDTEAHSRFCIEVMGGDAREVYPFQEAPDIRLAGDLIRVLKGDKILAFRSGMVSTRGALPLLRESLGVMVDGLAQADEAYPIFLVQIGIGFLFASTLDLKSTKTAPSGREYREINFEVTKEALCFFLKGLRSGQIPPDLPLTWYQKGN